MQSVPTVVIGAGQAGLAISRSLSDRGQEHVVLERGRVAQSWTERWDSLRLLTPNWMSRLPGFRYTGDDPDGFMRRDEIVDYLRAYSRSFPAPVEENSAVLSVRPTGGEWRVETGRGTWRSQNVVVATGYSQENRIPALDGRIPPGLFALGARDYRNPRQLPAGGVLVVGASASGAQLADEFARDGRRVVVAVGSHRRLPRRYRGRDIFHWLDAIGLLDRAPDPAFRKHEQSTEPSSQLAGRASGENLDLATLRALGVTLSGRLTGFRGGRAIFADDLAATVRAADERNANLLAEIDLHIRRAGLEGDTPPAPPWSSTPLGPAPLSLDLEAEGIRSIVWASGYRRSYPWLQAPVLDVHGELVQRRGLTPARGLYVLGIPFMIRRRSNFLDGVGLDAVELADRIANTASRVAERGVA